MYVPTPGRPIVSCIAIAMEHNTLFLYRFLLTRHLLCRSGFSWNTVIISIPFLLLLASQSRLAKVQAHDLLDLLKQQYTSHKSKNIEFLLTVEQLCRRMRGGRLTSCKSGKDRTSMSVTLEECGLLRANHHLHRDTFMRTLSTLRRSVITEL